MTKFALWIAALGVSALGSSAANAQSMTLTSSDIKEGGTIVNEQVFKGFGCTGGNVSPALSWSGAPSGTKSFAVAIYDPDAPTGSGWWHWVVFNLPPGTASLPKGAGEALFRAVPTSEPTDTVAHAHRPATSRITTRSLFLPLTSTSCPTPRTSPPRLRWSGSTCISTP